MMLQVYKELQWMDVGVAALVMHVVVVVTVVIVVVTEEVVESRLT